VFCLCSGAGEESFVFKKKILRQFCNTFENWSFSLLIFEQNNCVAITKQILHRPKFFPRIPNGWRGYMGDVGLKDLLSFGIFHLITSMPL